MHHTFLTLLLGLGFFLFGSVSTLSASTAEGDSPEPQMAGSIQLPAWGVAESREGFDIRIWPEEVILWLEQENLRDMIADPELPEDEKEALRQILAHQRAWRPSLDRGS